MTPRAVQLPLALPKCVLSRTGAVFSGSLSQEEWLDIWRRLAALDHAVNWVKGDWYNAGRPFIDAAAAVAGAMDEDLAAVAIAKLIPADGATRSSLWNLGWVARRVPHSLRREGLSWSHHKEVAALPAPEQRRWLAQAEEKAWAVADLREALFARERAGKGPALLRFVPLRWCHEFMRYVGEDAIASWAPDRRRALAKQLRPLLLWIKPLYGDL